MHCLTESSTRCVARRVLQALPCLLAALLVGAPQPAGAQAFTSFLVDCSGVKLKDAHGVGVAKAKKHDYEFSGSCRLYWTDGDSQETIRVFPVEAKATWDLHEKTLRESLRILGAFKWNKKVIGGVVTSAFLCSDDPLVTSAACNGFEHKNQTALDQLSEPYQKASRPLLQGKTAIFQAAYLSKQHPVPNEAVAPPPKTAEPHKKPPQLKEASGQPAVQAARVQASPNLIAAVANAAAAAAPHVVIRAPQTAEVRADGTVHLDIAVPDSAVQQHGLADVQLEWEWAPDSGRLPNRNPDWTAKSMLRRLKWNGHDGELRTAAIEIPHTRFTESTKWRVRASASTEAILPSPWVEFVVRAP